MKGLKNITAKITGGSKGLTKSKGRADVSWTHALFFVFLLLVVIVSFNVYVFLQVNEGDFSTISPSQNATEKIIDEELLKQTQERYLQKTQQFQEYRENPPEIPTI